MMRIKTITVSLHDKRAVPSEAGDGGLVEGGGGCGRKNKQVDAVTTNNPQTRAGHAPCDGQVVGHIDVEGSVQI